MASKIVFVFILSLLLRVSHSLPVSLDVKTMQSTDSVPESGLTERITVVDSETIIRLEDYNKFVQRFSTETLLKAIESFEGGHGKRIKRFIAKTQALCPADMIEYGGQCLPKEEFEEYNDAPEGYND